jgi:hypothetical protein
LAGEPEQRGIIARQRRSSAGASKRPRTSGGAQQGEDAGIHELPDVSRRPYDNQPGREPFGVRRTD